MLAVEEVFTLHLQPFQNEISQLRLPNLHVQWFTFNNSTFTLVEFYDRKTFSVALETPPLLFFS